MDTPHDPTLPTDDRDATAAAESFAGIGIPLEDVERWVESWDTADELPMPQARDAG